MIIALFGPPGAGKDTVGEILVKNYGFERVAFADKVRELALRINPHICEANASLGVLVSLYGWDKTKRDYMEVRQLLENIGNGARQTLGEQVWFNAAMQKYLDYPTKNIVISDLRKANERELLQYHYGYDALEFWCILRDGCVKRPGDEWEEGWAKRVIVNDSTKKFLEGVVKSIHESRNKN